MLPTPPTPARSRLLAWRSPPFWRSRPPGRRRRPLVALLSLLLVAGLGLGLGGCARSGQPSQGVLLRALGLQIALTQRSIATALALEPAGLPQVSRVRVERQEEVAIADGRGLHLSGRFDWRLADDPIRVDSPFELWLQRGERGQVWRLARPLAAQADSVQTSSASGTSVPGSSVPGTSAESGAVPVGAVPAGPVQDAAGLGAAAQDGSAQNWLIDPLPLPGESAG